MSGYLRRMAGAARAQARVHPFVEGMYGGRTESAAPVVEEVERRVVAPAARVSEVASGERTADVVRPTLHGVRPTLHEKDEAPEPIQVRPTSQISERRAGRLETKGPEEGERFEALLPEVVGEGAGFARPRQESEALGDRAKATHSFATRLRKDGPSSAQGEAEEWKFEPLVKEARGEGSKPMADFVDHRAPEVLRPAVRDEAVKDGAAGLLPPAHRDKAATDGIPGRMAERRMERHAQARAEPQGDAIQIHIGRIEVIAMPPAAPRSVAVPARKTQTLDEYLKQRTGRPG